LRAHCSFHREEPRAAIHFRAVASLRHGAMAPIHARNLHAKTERDAKSAWKKSLLQREAPERQPSQTRRLQRKIFNSDSPATSTCARATARQSECALRVTPVLQKFSLERLQILRKLLRSKKCAAAVASCIAAARRCAMIPPGAQRVAKRGRQ
jgi:hypothetical protein